jgi:DNA-nicking Smr family endonuclease
VSTAGKGPPARRRILSDDEATLWEAVARSIKPLRRPRTKVDPKVKNAAVERPAEKEPLRIQPEELFAGVRAPPTPQISKPALSPIDRRTKQKLRRGREAIDARLDLHGMTQDQAHRALSRFLYNAQSEGMKFVIVVTGKGLRGASGSERGVLRREVPRWLGMPEFRDVVVGFEVASVAHGGEGALYVRVRRGEM